SRCGGSSGTRPATRASPRPWRSSTSRRASRAGWRPNADQKPAGMKFGLDKPDRVGRPVPTGHNGRVPLSFLPLAVDREVAIVAALAALIVAALTVSFGAWFLLAREWRRERAD